MKGIAVSDHLGKFETDSFDKGPTIIDQTRDGKYFE